MKNTLGRINNRINEAEEQISQLEENGGNHCHRREKEKRMKRNEDSLETSRTISNTSTFTL